MDVIEDLEGLLVHQEPFVLAVSDHWKTIIIIIPRDEGARVTPYASRGGDHSRYTVFKGHRLLVARR